MPLKNHIGRKAKRVQSRLKSTFGFDLKDLDKALALDIPTLKGIAVARDEAAIAKVLLPALREAYLNIYDGTAELNKTKADILKSGATNALKIDRAMMESSLLSTEYQHKRRELAAEYVTRKMSESQRHKYQQDYILVKAYADAIIARVDGEAKLIEQQNRPKIKQLSEDKSYELKEAQHVLGFGEKEDTSLITHRNYKANPIMKSFTALRAFVGL